MKQLNRLVDKIKQATQAAQFQDRFEVAIVATFWIAIIVGLIVLSAKHPTKDFTRPEHRFTPSAKFY